MQILSYHAKGFFLNICIAVLIHDFYCIFTYFFKRQSQSILNQGQNVECFIKIIRTTPVIVPLNTVFSAG